MSRVGVVGGDAGLLSRLRWKAPPECAVEPVQHAERFAADAAHDHVRRVVVVPLSLPDVWSVLEGISAHADVCPIVAVYQGGDEQAQLRALAHGSSALVPAEADPLRVLRAADAALEGDAMIPARTLAAFTAMLPRSDVGSASISEQEKTWLRLLAEGTRHQDLAEQTGWSERQMRRRLHGLYLRMGVTNRHQAIAVAAQHGLLR